MRGNAGFAQAIAPQQSSFFIAQICQNKIGRFFSRQSILLLFQYLTTFGQRCDHETVPGSQDFIVFKRVNPLFSFSKQFLTAEFQKWFKIRLRYLKVF